MKCSLPLLLASPSSRSTTTPTMYSEEHGNLGQGFLSTMANFFSKPVQASPVKNTTNSKHSSSEMRWLNIWEEHEWFHKPTSPIKAFNHMSYYMSQAHTQDYKLGLIFWGGEDIATELYEAEPYIPSARKKASPRDQFEATIYKMAVANKIPVVAVCRGAQLIHALNGGFLHQDITGHRMCNHRIFLDVDGLVSEIDGNSDHHQALAGEPDGCDVLGYAEDGTLEIVHYPEKKTLAIQGHPEWIIGSDFDRLCRFLIKTKLLNQG